MSESSWNNLKSKNEIVFHYSWGMAGARMKNMNFFCIVNLVILSPLVPSKIIVIVDANIS